MWWFPAYPNAAVLQAPGDRREIGLELDQLAVVIQERIEHSEPIDELLRRQQKLLSTFDAAAQADANAEIQSKQRQAAATGDPFGGACRVAQTAQDSPLRTLRNVGGWPASLSDECVNQIETVLLGAAARCWTSPTLANEEGFDPLSSADVMRLAFDRIAQVLFDAGVLKPDRPIDSRDGVGLDDIVLLVWETARLGDWLHLDEETRQAFRKQRNATDVWSDQEALFRAETTKWKASLLAGSPSANAPPIIATPTKREDRLQAETKAKKSPTRRPLKAIRDDETRRVEAKKYLQETLQNYVQTVPHLDLNRLAEIWGQYAAALYDSLAESYRGLPVDAEALFGEMGVLAGGQTLAGVAEDIKRIRIRRPEHWPDPQLSRDGTDSPELHRELRDLLVGEYVSFTLLDEDQWFRGQLSDSVAERIQKWKGTFAKPDPTQAPDPTLCDIVFVGGTAETMADAGSQALRLTVTRLQALKFALRHEFQEGQTTPLKSWEEVLGELLSMASDQNIPSDLRTKLRDELNPRDEGLRSVLNAESSELRKEAGKIIIDRVLEPSEATRFRKSPGHSDQMLVEYHRNLTARAFDDIKREDPVFFSDIVQTVHRVNKAKLKSPCTTNLSLNREEQHDLLRKFSADHLGLSAFELADASRWGDWKKRYLSWLVKQDLRVRGPRGAPKKPEAEKTRAKWAEMGKPSKLTAEVCEALARHTYGPEYDKAKPRSPARRTLHDRVAQQVRPLMKKPSPPASPI
jgi:hypothetical protein